MKANLTTKTCSQCGFGNPVVGKFCSECGQRFASLQTDTSVDTPTMSGGLTSHSAAPRISPRARFEQFTAALSPEDARSRLSQSIEENRRQLKTLGASIPRATNPLIMSLMESLKSLPGSEVTARTAIVTALGRTGDPAILPPLLLVSGAAAKDVRRAVADALGSLRHPLAAYLLLNMLLDGSSRVRQAALQSLVRLNQPHTVSSIFAACLFSRTLQSVLLDTLKQGTEAERIKFFQSASEPATDRDAGLGIVADWLRDEFRNEFAKSLLRDHQAAAEIRSQSNAGLVEAGVYSAVPDLRESQSCNVDLSNESNSQVRFLDEFEEKRGQSPQSPKFAFPAAQDHGVANSTTSAARLTAAGASSPASGSNGESTDSHNDSLSDVRIPTDSELQNSDPRQAPQSVAPSIGPDRLSNARSLPAGSIPPADDSTVSLDLRALGSANDDDENNDDEQRLAQQLAAAFADPSERHSPADDSDDLNSDSFADITFFDSMMEHLEDDSASNHSGHLIGAASGLNESSGSMAAASLSSLLAGPATSGRPAVSNQGYAGWGETPSLMPGSAGSHASAAARHASHYPSLTPAGSGPFIPAMNQQFMTPQGSMPLTSPPPAIAMSASPAPPAGQAMDLTASSPFIDAFTPAFTQTASPSTGFLVATTNGDSKLTTDSPPGGHAVVKTAESAASVAAADSQEDEAAAAEAAKVAREKSLARLAAARDVALRKLVESADEIPNTLPRLLKKRVAKLMATPATDIESVVEQIRYLGESGSPAVLSTLSSFCQKPSKVVRAACADAMGNVAHPGSAILLLKLLSDKSGTVTETAIKSLSKLDLDATRPVLLAAGLCNNSLRTIVTAGVESASDDAKPEWEKFLLGVFQSHDSEAVAFAVSLLVRITGDTHLEIYGELVSNDSPAVRAAAVDALARTQSKRSISKINDALLDPDPLVRAQAATSVANMYSPRSLELLQQLVFDGNLMVRRNAAHTMSRIDETDLADVLEKALDQETDATTVEYLLAALQRNGGEHSLSVLQRHIEGETGQFREQAVKALRKLKIPASIPIFLRLLEDRAPGLRRQSVEQLAVLKADAALPRIRELLRQDPDESVRSACAKALGDFGDEKSRTLLEEALEDHALVRLQAVIAMGRVGGASSGPALLALLKDSQPDIRYQAVRAVGQLKLEGLEEFISGLLEDSDEMVRRGAEQSLQDLGQSIGKIRSNRWQKRFLSLASKLTPSTLAGAIPGGSKSLLAVIVVLTIVGGYWGLSNVSFYAGGGEQLPVGWIVGLDVSAQNKITAALREDSVLDIWSIEDNSLVTRVAVPETTSRVLVEPKGGILLFMENELGRLDPESGYDPEKLEKVELPGVPSAFSFHEASGSICFFYRGNNSTSLKVMDPVSLKESRSFTIKGHFEGSSTISSDFSVAIALDEKGLLRLADLTTGEVISESVGNIVGNSARLGQVFAATFTGDTKHIVFCGSEGSVVMNAGNLSLVRFIESPDAYGFINAKPTNKGSDLVILSASGVVYNVTNQFEKVEQSQIERDERFDLFSLSGGGELVAVANTEGYDFDVYSVIEKKTLMKSTQ